MIELQTGQRHIAKDLFCNYPYLCGYVVSALSGLMGTVSVDDLERPTVGHIILAWANILAGDAKSDEADAMLRQILPNTILVGENARWVDAFHGRWGHRLEKWRRTAFGPGEWDVKKLTRLTQQLPIGYTIKQVTSSEEVKSLILMGDGLVDFRNYPSPEDFLNRGIAFIAKSKTEIVSGCTSYAIGGGKFDISVTTRREHQRQGLAQAVAARMILHGLEHEIEPCWDAPHEVAGVLATKLGFTTARPYTAYRVLKVREHWNSSSWM